MNKACQSTPPPQEVETLFSAWLKTSYVHDRRNQMVDWMKKNRSTPLFHDVAYYLYLLATTEPYGTLLAWKISSKNRTRTLDLLLERLSLTFSEAKSLIERLPGRLKPSALSAVINHFIDEADDQHTLVSIVDLMASSSKGQRSRIFSKAFSRGRTQVLEHFLEKEHYPLWEPKIDQLQRLGDAQFIARFCEAFPQAKDKLLPTLFNLSWTYEETTPEYLKVLDEVLAHMLSKDIPPEDALDTDLYVFWAAVAKRQGTLHKFKEYWDRHVFNPAIEEECSRLSS
jgi:hypothetical protein